MSPDHDHEHGHGLDHDHGAHDHARELAEVSQNRLWVALVINLAFLIVEVIGGVWTGSLALLADAGHMLTDVSALGVAIFAARLARRPSTPERTFGFLRAEVIGAFVNGATLVAIVGWVSWEAVQRLFAPSPVAGWGMLGIAFTGLVANVVSALILMGGRRDNVNIEGAFLHMTADALGSVGAVGAGLVILLTGWTPIDPIASLVIAGLILWSSLGLLKRTADILLNATPAELDYHEIQQAMEENAHVREVHDLHIWSVTSGVVVLTAHVELRPDCCDTQHWQKCLREMQDMLHERFEIEHSTLQFEPTGYVRDERPF